MAKAQLYVRGMKDPIELENNEAKAAEGLIADASKPMDTPFYIQGVWSGRKSDMKFVVFPKVEASFKAKEFDVMTDVEAKAFEKEIAQDKDKSKLMFSSTAHWDLCYMARGNAINLRVIKCKGANNALAPEWGIINLDTYLDMQEKLNCYGFYLHKKGYTEKIKVAGLEELAKTVSI